MNRAWGILLFGVAIALGSMAITMAQTTVNGIPGQTVSLAGLSGTTASIGGGLLTGGLCTTPVTITVQGAVQGKNVQITPANGTLQQAGTYSVAAVTGPNTVSAEVCAYVASITPTSTTYTVQVLQ